MKLHRLILTVLTIFVLTGSLATAADNSVLYWNGQALNATQLARNPPPMSSMILATYHIAIFDAVNGITHTNHGWLINDPAPAGADVDAAVAGAAYTVMTTFWSPITNPHNLQVAYDKALSSIPDGQSKTDGLAWGKHVAEAVIAKRSTSGFDKPIPGKYSSNEAGKWRETPSSFRPPLMPFWAKVVPFAMTSCDQFRAPPPNALDSKEYAEEVAYVNKVGARDGAERTEYE